MNPVLINASRKRAVSASVSPCKKGKLPRSLPSSIDASYAATAIVSKISFTSSLPSSEPYSFSQ